MYTSGLARVIGLSVGFGFASVGQAWALPTIGPAFEADAPVLVLEDKSVYDVGSATDGERMLTVFEEGGHIRGMLTDSSGTALLPGLAFYAEAPLEGWNTKPSLAFGASHYALAYSSTPGIFVLRIGTDGVAVGAPVRVSETGYSPKIGWVGDKFILVWYESNGIGTEVAATTVTNDGVVGATQIISVDTAGEPVLATNAAGALVTWAIYRDYDADVEGVLLDTAGEIRTPEFLLEQGGNAWGLKVASSGSDFLAAWSDETGVRAVTVTQQGVTSEVLDVAEVGGTSMLALGGNAGGYVAAWQAYGLEEPHWTVRRIGVDGELEAPNTSASYIGARELTLVGNDDGYWVAYREVGLLGAYTDHQLSIIGQTVPLSVVKNSQDSAELFWNGSNYVLTWADERFGDGTYTGRMMRVNTAGERVDADAIALDDDPADRFWHSAEPLADGKMLLGTLAMTAWREFVRVVNEDGTLNPPLDLGDAGTMGGVTLAAHGDRRLAVYDGAGGTIWARLFDAQGAPSGEPHRLALSEVYDARAHAGAEGFLLQVGSNSAGTGLAALRDDWTLGPVRKLNDGSFPVDVAVGGGKTVVVWAYHDGVRVARFWNGEDWAGEEFTLGSDGRWGDTEWDGAQFAAVWQDSDYHSHWTTFDTEGNVAAPEPLFRDVPVSSDPFASECNGPKLASNGDGQCLLTCVRYDRDYSRRLVNYLVQSPSEEAGETSTLDPGDATDEVSARDAGPLGSWTTGESAATAVSDSTSIAEHPVSTSAQTAVASSEPGAESSSGMTSITTVPTTTGPSTGSPVHPLPDCSIRPGASGAQDRVLPLALLLGITLARRVHRRRAV